MDDITNKYLVPATTLKEGYPYLQYYESFGKYSLSSGPACMGILKWSNNLLKTLEDERYIEGPGIWMCHHDVENARATLVDRRRAEFNWIIPYFLSPKVLAVKFYPPRPFHTRNINTRVRMEW